MKFVAPHWITTAIAGVGIVATGASTFVPPPWDLALKGVGMLCTALTAPAIVSAAGGGK